MGADLITYIVVGPNTIDLSDDQRAAVVKQLRINAKQLREDCLKELNESNCEPTQEAIAEVLADNGNNSALAEVLVDDTLVESVLDEFLSTWHDWRRDASTRLLPGDDSRCIYVAGEMSWGDTPSGAAYQAIDIAYGLGLLPLLGIE